MKNTTVAAPFDVIVGAVHGGEIETESAAPSTSGAHWVAKDEVDVEWHGRWWPAVVLERRGGERWLVHYAGYGAEWDEVVGFDRIRERHIDEPEESNEPVEVDVDP